jgi:hypothetical protein
VWERVQLAGSALTSAVVLVAAVVQFALADGGVSPVALEALNAIDGNFWVGFNAALGVMMVGAAGMLLAQAGWFRRLGWVALVREAAGAPATVAPRPA